MPQILSILVMQSDAVIFEYYRTATGKSEKYEVRSVTRSFISALIGVALQQGRIKSVKQKISDILPGAMFTENAPANRNITIEQLLTMTGGFTL
ncbi:MAG: serine hydrolase [Deltaproteobacteria bacterium]|nr:serine hydrolase [Deltaproteobacteria bacterium]